jgi:hypothetical protein
MVLKMMQSNAYSVFPYWVVDGDKMGKEHKMSNSDDWILCSGVRVMAADEAA